MNIIRQLRHQSDMTQVELARTAGTSQSTIAAYETGRKSPTMRTVNRLASALGLELETRFILVMTREDRRSLVFHRTIAEKLQTHPDETIERARTNLKRLTKQHPQVRHLFSQWVMWLELPRSVLIANLLETNEAAREMRQVSPFAGVFSALERAEIIRQFRSEYAE